MWTEGPAFGSLCSPSRVSLWLAARSLYRMQLWYVRLQRYYLVIHFNFCRQLQMESLTPPPIPISPRAIGGPYTPDNRPKWPNSSDACHICGRAPPRTVPALLPLSSPALSSACFPVCGLVVVVVAVRLGRSHFYLSYLAFSPQSRLQKLGACPLLPERSP